MRSTFNKFGVAALASALVFWSAPAASQVKVGVINSLSGTFAEFGKRYQTGIEVALEEINNNGGVNGERIEIITEDDASQAQSALAALENMKNQGVALIIGTYASSMTGPLAQLATRQKMPLIVLGSADDSITKPGSPWVFRAKHNSTIVAQTYFDFFDHLRDQDDSVNKVAILYANSAWPASLAEIGTSIAKERGYEIVASEAYNEGTTDFRPILNGFRSKAPDILYFCSYAADGVAITRQLREVGLNAKAFALDTSSSLPSFIDQLGEPADYIVSAVTWAKDGQYEGGADLAKRLGEKAGGEPSFYEAEGYMEMRVAADALARAKSLDPEDVRIALTETDLQTPAGDVMFENEDGFQNQNPIRDVIIQIQDGEHVTVFPEDLAASEPRFPIPAWDER
ncbi:MAG TPA: ABC transporter substrate-binding protein [Burkholderiaceae bacterium]|nr:ABC transporter substrate-binding protein [Burkholderiaceae bacterium]